MAHTDRFAVDYSDLDEELRAARHSVSWTAHVMKISPADDTIRDYEQSLAYEAKIRAKFGERHDADMAARSAAAGI